MKNTTLKLINSVLLVFGVLTITFVTASAGQYVYAKTKATKTVVTTLPAPAPILSVKESPKIIQTPIAKPQAIQVNQIPTKLIIPSVGVTSKILSVGTTKGGNMDTPHNFEDVGWYKNGPKPGETGS